MNGGAPAVLVITAVPLVWVVVLLVSDARHNRRVRARPERTVAGIRERVELEQVETDAANAPTEVLPAVQPASADQPTERLPPVLLKRQRPYAQRPTPYPRRQLPQPPSDLMGRVLDGLRRLPTSPPCPSASTEPRRPRPDPDV